MRTLAAAMLLWLLGCPLAAVAAEGQILSFTDGVDELELYQTPEAEEASLTVAPGELALPTAVLGVSDNGMLKLRHKGAEYWVISDDVATDMTRKVDAACEPKVAGALVAHGKRGAGGECQ